MPDQPSKNDPILVTGGMGFIGSHLTHRLVSEGYQVILLDVKPNFARISEIADKVTVVEGDVGIWSDVVSTLKEYKIRHVFHTAARLSVEAERQIGGAYSCNIAGTFNVLEAARIMQVQRLVFP